MNRVNNKWLSITTIILLVANILTLTLLWSNHKNNTTGEAGGGNRPPRGQVFEFITKELSLTTLQQDAYKILREEHQAGQRPLQDSIRKAKDAFFELLKTPVTDDAALRAASDKGLAYQQQLEIFTFKHFQKLRALCTPEQQKKFDEIIKQVLHQMTAPGRRPGPPPPGAVNEGGPPFQGKDGERPEDVLSPPAEK